MRHLADQISFADAKQQLLEMGEDYERLAQRAEKQTAEGGN